MERRQQLAEKWRRTQWFKRHRKTIFKVSLLAQLISCAGAVISLMKKDRGSAKVFALLAGLGAIFGLALMNMEEKTESVDEDPYDDIWPGPQPKKNRSVPEDISLEAASAVQKDSKPASGAPVSIVDISAAGSAGEDEELPEEKTPDTDMQRLDEAIRILKGALSSEEADEPMGEALERELGRPDVSQNTGESS